MKRYKTTTIWIVLFMMGWIHVYGQEDTLSVNISGVDGVLSSYLETAARNNPSVQQKWSAYKAALQKVPQVGSLPDPNLNLGFFLKPMELPGGNQVADLQLMQMFPWFGVIKNAKDEMSLMAKASYESLEDTKLQVFYDVQSSWYNLYRNREQVRIMQHNLDLLRQMMRLATVRYKTGSSISVPVSSNSMKNGVSGSPVSSGMSTMPPSGNSTTVATAPMPTPAMSTSSGGGLTDLYTLQLEENELVSSLSSLNDEYQTQLFKFNKLLNRTMDKPVVLPEKGYVDTFEPPMDSALSNNPMLTMLQFERESLEAKQKMSDRMGYPMVGVGLKYSILSKNPASTSMMNGQDMLMPMVSVSLPIYRKKYKAIKQETEWQKTASEQSFQATQNALQSDYQEALFNYRDALRRVKLYEGQNQLVEKTYQLQLKRFASSATDLSEIRSIGRQQLDYALKEMNAHVDVLQAQAKLRQLTARF